MKNVIAGMWALVAAGVTGVAALGGAGCGGDGAPTAGRTGPVTFWQDVAPIYNQKCVKCHQAGGIAPFALDNYTEAHAVAAVALDQVKKGTMPPYFMVHDDSCGSFDSAPALTAIEKQTIEAWVNGGKLEGTPAVLTVPPTPMLAGAVEVVTPTFAPAAQGGQLAQFDEYRCFLMDVPLTSDAFLTGYQVVPGDSSIVHHVIGYVVDPQRAATGALTNAAVMQMLDAQSPERLGWPCFGGAGEGVNPSGVPVTWGPGEGVVQYPAGMGLRMRTTDKLVVQVHYNLAEVPLTGPAASPTDSTTIRLAFADAVARQLAFLLPDPFLESLFTGAPDMLPPQKINTPYTWTRTGQAIGVNSAAGVDLVAVAPHMHARGVNQRLRLGSTCAARLENWNFHWQQFYFYKTYPRILPTTQVELTCEYNTLDDLQPVLPGWGTRNEMCLAVMMVAL